MANTTGKKFGGRSKGTPNKTTAETKQALQNVLSKQIDRLQVTINKLEPIDKVNALAKLLPYILPKQQDIVINTEPLSEEARERRIAELKQKLLES
jgi:hypothetical protein